MNKTAIFSTIIAVTIVAVIFASEQLADAQKSEKEIFLRVFSDNNGELVCPNGIDKLSPPDIRMSLSIDEQSIGVKGQFDARTAFGPAPQKEFGATLFNGEIKSGSFRVTGIGTPDAELQSFCGEPAIILDVITVWGDCGDDATINFESESGYTGTFTDKVVCL